MASGLRNVPHQQAEHMAAPTSLAIQKENPCQNRSRPHMALSGQSQTGSFWRNSSRCRVLFRDRRLLDVELS